MIGLGTIINTAAILCGGVLGMLFGKFLKNTTQDALTKVCGVGTIFIAIYGALEKMPLVSGDSAALHSKHISDSDAVIPPLQRVPFVTGHLRLGYEAGGAVPDADEIVKENTLQIPVLSVFLGVADMNKVDLQ